ncbi:MAG: fasciclin domain-containing protein [Spirochaetales bacterium]|nr:fasciclin domain-containing protein [Spirochaetales bacterium]
MKKTMKFLVSLLMGLVLVLGVPAYAEEQDIVGIASGSEDFSILVAALEKAGLVEALQAEGPFTVFAPTNAAFEALLAGLSITAEDLLNHPQLADVLLYHVVPGQVMSTSLSNGMTAETLGGETLTVDLTDGVKINASNVTTPDILAKNGVIHVIDQVLVPDTFQLAPATAPLPSIVDIAVGSEDFTILVAALQKAGLVEALQAEGPFTVFAPTNTAFEALLGALGITAEELLGQPQLADVLLYHVVSGKVMSTDLQNGMTAETLGGQAIAIDLTDGVKINDSKVTSADIEASNGVIHVIDSVLVPETFTLVR